MILPPLGGRSRREPIPGTLAFVAVMLGSVTFDGFICTNFWQDFRCDLVGALRADSPTLADTVTVLVNTAGLAIVIALVALAYLTALVVARRLASGQLDASDFVLTLVPIALADAVAHYFSLLVVRGQYVLPLASDPFGRGWDLVGTADYRPCQTRLLRR